MSYKYIDEGRKHLHTLRGAPLLGTSTVAKTCVDKSAPLMGWALKLMYQYIKDNAETDEDGNMFVTPEVLEEAKVAHRESRDKSATVGTARHETLEDYVRECIKDNDGKPLDRQIEGIQPFIAWSLLNIKRFIFTEAHCYSERLWLGGIADIGFEMLDGKLLIGDHKSSAVGYFEQYIQGALYDIQLKENGILDAEGNKLGEWKGADGIVVFPFRSDPFTPDIVWAADEYRAVSEGIVATYKLSQTRIIK